MTWLDLLNQLKTMTDEQLKDKVKVEFDGLDWYANELALNIQGQYIIKNLDMFELEQTLPTIMLLRIEQ